MTDKAAHHFAAPTRVVFTILADPERAARWLDADVAGRLSVVPADLSVRWAPAHEGGSSGRALVRDANDGGSVVYLELFTGDRSGEFLAGAMRRLAEEVAAAA